MNKTRDRMTWPQCHLMNSVVSPWFAVAVLWPCRGLAVASSSVGARWIWPCLFSILNPLSIGEPRILHATSQRQSRSTDHRYLLDLTSQSSVMAFECRYSDECVAGDYLCKSYVQFLVIFYFYFFIYLFLA